MASQTVRLSAALLLGWTGLTARAAGVPDFDRDVRPILAEHCLECHSLDKAKGGLSLSTREDALKSLKSGHAGVVPGKPELSGIVARAASTDLDERMPPEGRNPLSPRQVEVLRAWVGAGAAWPEHWAYRPVSQPSPPAVVQTSWPRVDLDRFILSRLEAEAVSPSVEADKITLLRRVHFDLLGLPPAPEMAEAFLKNPAPGAYEKMVDAALASPHFGERWGRHWLDMARYADSDGYEKDRPRPDAWRYRDWVIAATNQDLPFDAFTIQQLAGDLLPDASPEEVLATAFHRQTLTNTEGGTDQEQFRVEAVFDRTETTGTVWMGLSVGCARCHSHKYDQISHEEYFQLYSFFNNADEATRQVTTSPQAWTDYLKRHGKEAAQLTGLQKAHDQACAAARNRLPEWEKGIQARLATARETEATAKFEPLNVVEVKSQSGGKLERLDDGSWLAVKGRGENDTYTLVVKDWTGPLHALRLEALPHESLPGGGPGQSGKGNFVLSEFSVVLGDTTPAVRPVRLHSPKADFEQKGYAARGAVDGDPASGWAVQPQFGKVHHLTVQMDEPVLPGKGKGLLVRLDHRYKGGQHNLGRFRLLASRVETEESIAPADVLRVLKEEPLRRNDVVIKPLLEWVEKVDPAAAEAGRLLADARSKLPAPPLMDVRVIAQRSRDPRETRLMHRGDFLSPAQAVRPGALAVLPAVPARDGGVPDRLDFARWLVSRENPLTPRVTVNHIWARLFGEGLVRTVNDFGVRGDRPTHPELLDWLASDFMNRGWSRKQLIKSILMSATYRQSSVHRPEMQERDPLNKLLHRQNRLRVEGEIVRDLHLAASGLLSLKVGGPSVFPPLPPNVADLSYANNFKWATSTGADQYRRGMYTFFKRTAPHPDLTTFDCPDANTTSVRRTVSNTPLQALTTLNAGAFTDAAKGLALRVLVESRAQDEDRMARLFALCLSRAPEAREKLALAELLKEARDWYVGNPADAGLLAGGAAPAGVPEAEFAAWTATVRILLNADEFITRE
jgi:hypothetical protein